MPRGGARPGAGRKPNPAKKVAAKKVAAMKKPAAKAFAPDGLKSQGTPDSWPFGALPAEAPAAAPAPAPAAGATDDDGEPLIAGGEPLAFLQAIINEPKLKLSVRMQAAAIAAPFVHAKPAPVGKKQQQADEAKKVGGKFAAAAPPKLVHSRG